MYIRDYQYQFSLKYVDFPASHILASMAEKSSNEKFIKATSGIPDRPMVARIFYEIYEIHEIVCHIVIINFVQAILYYPGFYSSLRDKYSYLRDKYQENECNSKKRQICWYWTVKFPFVNYFYRILEFSSLY